MQTSSKGKRSSTRPGSSDRSSILGLSRDDSGVNWERSSRCADHAPGTAVGGDRAHAFPPLPGLEAPSPFLHQLSGRNDGDNFETWKIDVLRRTTTIPCRTDDVTAGDKLASDSPSQALPFQSRSVARTSCLSKRLAGVNRSGGDEARQQGSRSVSSGRSRRAEESTLECLRMSTDGAGSSSSKPSGSVSAIIACHRVNAALGNARNVLTVLKVNEKSAEVDSASHAECQPASKGKEDAETGKTPLGAAGSLRDLPSVWLGFSSSLGAAGVTCSTASSLSLFQGTESTGQTLRRIDFVRLFQVPVSSASDPDV